MKKFSAKSLLELGDFYVYGLIDPRYNQIFYIGKGTGQRVFKHEEESSKNPNADKLKLKKIAEIKNAGHEVEKIIIHCKLTESEAFAAEAALINAFNYVRDIGLTNIDAGHHSTKVLTVEEFEKCNGAVELKETDIKHKIMVIKINKLFQRGMPEDVLYDAVRGVWRANLERAKNVDYVVGVYNSLIVAVYKPSVWYRCNDQEAKKWLPRQNQKLEPNTETRIFFVDKRFGKNEPKDEAEEFYLYKSIAFLEKNQKSQNPITYLNPCNF